MSDIYQEIQKRILILNNFKNYNSLQSYLQIDQ